MKQNIRCPITNSYMLCHRYHNHGALHYDNRYCQWWTIVSGLDNAPRYLVIEDVTLINAPLMPEDVSRETLY